MKCVIHNFNDCVFCKADAEVLRRLLEESSIASSCYVSNLDGENNMQTMTPKQQEAYNDGVRNKAEGAQIYQCPFQSKDTESTEYWQKGFYDQADAELRGESLY